MSAGGPTASGHSLDEVMAVSPVVDDVNGATAAVISDMGFDWRLGKAFFIISRVPGLVAHACEEMTREKPMRKLGPLPFEYDGPDEREI